VELPDPHGHQGMIRERATGIEPAFSAWERVARQASDLGVSATLQLSGEIHYAVVSAVTPYLSFCIARNGAN
jgi:hypothetical protein